jgi:D-alanyl-D-alanine carboxypeptidase (penicillin-binding protein 5/6)
LLAVYAMKNPDFAAAAGSRSARLEYGNPPYDRTLSNHNRMLRCYEGACGVKTGFTKKSRRCLVSCAKRGGVGVIAVTLNAPDDWNDHTAMLDYGFSVLETRDLPVPDGLSATVSSGTEPSVDGIFPPTELSLLPEDFDDLTYVVSMNDKLTAPVTEGDLIGVVTYYLSGSKIMEVPVTAQSRVDVPEYVPPKKDMLYWLWRLIGCK